VTLSTTGAFTVPGATNEEPFMPQTLRPQPTIFVECLIFGQKSRFSTGYFIGATKLSTKKSRFSSLF
jgi:hypothetical protein